MSDHVCIDQARDRNGQIHLNEMVALIEPQAKCELDCSVTYSSTIVADWQFRNPATIPQELRDDILNKLRAFVQNNVED